jgi:hypothetical protein
MPHFAVDETAHMHRKVTRAGNAAFGLWVRLGSYACDYLTDGVIPAEVVALYGTPPQMRKLLAVGMLHAAGHDCPRCPAAAEGDFVVHDYIGPNPSRATVEKKREQAAEKARVHPTSQVKRTCPPGTTRGLARTRTLPLPLPLLLLRRSKQARGPLARRSPPSPPISSRR